MPSACSISEPHRLFFYALPSSTDFGSRIICIDTGNQKMLFNSTITILLYRSSNISSKIIVKFKPFYFYVRIHFKSINLCLFLSVFKVFINAMIMKINSKTKKKKKKKKKTFLKYCGWFIIFVEFYMLKFCKF